MSASKHTPGPWRFVPHENGLEFDIVSGAEMPWPWYVATTHDMEGASEANARLIAAAPDLLDALKAAFMHCPVGSDAAVAALAAIRKAEGR